MSTQVHPWFLMVSLLLIFLIFCAVFFCFVCLRPVSCVPNVGSVCGVPFHDCPFGFLLKPLLYDCNIVVEKKKKSMIFDLLFQVM
jgi:hypothetical protein